ncbi:hypothetical protein ACMD2_26086 [Ananas comosus]|uniref:Uncharacterized protein n=1 Tax=Ananas comosus TaxID=4615 RepID=A0A199V5Z9_ANACO|nr:hypothetical protein ACMD2_26086 [Ananas comosus]
MSGVVEPIILAAVGWVASPSWRSWLNEGYLSLGINAEKKLEKMRDTVLPVAEIGDRESGGQPAPERGGGLAAEAERRLRRSGGRAGPPQLRPPQTQG